MEWDCEINISESKENDLPVMPYVTFRFIQLNMTPHCYNEEEIEYQIQCLVRHAKEMGQQVKRKLKQAKLRGDNKLP